jgi:hypothetical protein
MLRKEEEPSREHEQVKKHVMLVGSCPCKVSSEVHINRRRVSKSVWEDMGKATVPESEEEKDPKRTCMVLSKGREVVGLGYSRLLGDATRVPDKGGESAKSNWVDRIGGQIRLLRTAGVTGMAVWLSRQIGLLGSPRVTGTATQSQEILAGLPKIRLL